MGGCRICGARPWAASSASYCAELRSRRDSATVTVAARTRLAEDGPAHRRRCWEILQNLGGWFEVAEDQTPTRVEFDKALVNFFGNLLGQLKAIGETGAIHLLAMHDILPELESAETRELPHHVIAVGRAVQAYRHEETFETPYRSAMCTARTHLEHVPSSIKWLEAQLHAGPLEALVAPTEKWLLHPLTRYASTAGLDESTRYFTELIWLIEDRLTRAITAQSKDRGQGFLRAIARRIVR